MSSEKGSRFEELFKGLKLLYDLGTTEIDERTLTLELLKDYNLRKFYPVITMAYNPEIDDDVLACPGLYKDLQELVDLNVLEKTRMKIYFEKRGVYVEYDGYKIKEKALVKRMVMFYNLEVFNKTSNEL